MSTADMPVLGTEELSGDYAFDPVHTTFGFAARHAMVARVRGEFTQFEGSAHLDFADSNQSRVGVEIAAASIDTGNADRDAHLRSNDFFAMDDHPTITFDSTIIEALDDRHYRVSGDLTIRGATNAVTFDAEYTGGVVDPWGNTRVGFTGSFTIDRKDWGVKWNMALAAGGVMVSENVTIEFDVSAIKTS
jgi:polyisoprenoid-binding protein YceI